jgi:hypothetical protein
MVDQFYGLHSKWGMLEDRFTFILEGLVILFNICTCTYNLLKFLRKYAIIVFKYIPYD